MVIPVLVWFQPSILSSTGELWRSACSSYIPGILWGVERRTFTSAYHPNIQKSEKYGNMIYDCNMPYCIQLIYECRLRNFVGMCDTHASFFGNLYMCLKIWWFSHRKLYFEKAFKKLCNEHQHIKDIYLFIY